MTVYLALDPVTGHTQTTAGLIRCINASAAGIAAQGFAVADGYTGDRLVSIDETDDDVWNDDVEPGWYWRSGAVQPSKPLTNAEQVAVDIANFKEAVERESVDWERVVAEENFSPHTDSGHLWSDDLLYALLKPNIAGLVALLTTAKGTANDANILAYRARLDSFISIADTPGVISIYRNADKTVWRPLRMGERAYGYDTTTGGARTGVSFAVTYPTGTNVVTYDALAEVRRL